MNRMKKIYELALAVNNMGVVLEQMTKIALSNSKTIRLLIKEDEESTEEGQAELKQTVKNIEKMLRSLAAGQKKEAERKLILPS